VAKGTLPTPSRNSSWLPRFWSSLTRQSARLVPNSA